MIQSFPWNMESISWQLAQKDFRPVFFYRGLRHFAFGKTLGPVYALVGGMHDTREPAHSPDAAPPRRIGRHQLLFRETALQGK